MHLLGERFAFSGEMIGVFWKRESWPIKWHQHRFWTRQFFPVFASVVYGCTSLQAGPRGVDAFVWALNRRYNKGCIGRCNALEMKMRIWGEWVDILVRVNLLTLLLRTVLLAAGRLVAGCVIPSGFWRSTCGASSRHGFNKVFSKGRSRWD
jgi:hypothetical protein